MTRILLSIACGMVLPLFSCSNDASKKAESKEMPKQISHYTTPASGTVVASLEEEAVGRELNEFKFRVSIIADDNSDVGIYKAKLEYGHNINETTIELPEWPNDAVLKPAIQKGVGDNYFKIGFDPGDGKFRELYDVKADRSGTISLKKTTAYYPTQAN